MASISDPSSHSALQGHASPPSTYMVGRQRTSPLVHARQLGGHLALLHAFDTLRRNVESASGDLSRFPQEARIMDADTRWGWFLNLAVERFERWCKSIRDVQGDAIERTLPPIDVVMVWHAYLLNPIWYAEDTIRVPALSTLPRYTEYLSNHLESPEALLTSSPNVDRTQFWWDGTTTPYDPFDSAGVLTHITLRCPHCKSRTNVSILTSDGRGYAQSRFSSHCPSCRRSITRQSLGMYKLANNLAKKESEGPGAFLAGTLHTRDEMKDTRRATLIKNRIRSGIKAYSSLSSKSKRSVTTSDILTEFDHDASKLQKKLKDTVLPTIITRILYAYSDQRPFSIDLVGAVLRQGSFVRKMVELGWTQPGFPSDNNGALILEHCVTRYHAFLNLMADSPASFFVPTLDIDLAWHTHQLMANRYQHDCKALVNRYVDHDDKVEEGTLATGFDVTCRAWIDRYKVPYTYCGCPQPSPTFGQRLRRALGGKEPADTTLQPPDLATPGTHPSDHNAVFPMHHLRQSMRARERRQQKSVRRRQREAADSDLSDDPQRTTRCSHAEPFLYPIPLYYTPIGGCVVGAGGVIDSGAPFAGAQCAFGAGGSCGFGGANCGGSACAGGTGGGCGGGSGGCGGGGGGGCGGGGGGCGGGGGGGCGGG